MQKDKKLKKIAIVLASQSEIPQDVVTFLSKNLTRSELKRLGKFMRLELRKRTVTLSTAVDLTDSQKKLFKEMYEPLNVLFAIDKTLGGGVRVVKQDTVIDMSIKHYIIHMVQELSV